MNLPNDDYLKAMNYQYPQRIPVSICILPAAWMRYREDLDRLVAKYASLFAWRESGARDYDAVAGTYAEGEHTDAWGCVWTNVCQGMEAIVTGHPLKTREAVRSLKAPVKDIGFPHGFMYLRLADLRGFEELMVDFAEEPPELQQLIDVVLEYNLHQVDLLLASKKEPEMIFFGDDQGMQTSLPMGPEKWRKYLKPCYQAIFSRVRAAGHLVYMHTDGHIHEIIPDFVECGVNVINPQIRANGIDNLVRVCKGKVCVDLDLDRQLFPFATPAEIDAHIRDAVEKLGAPEGGLWLRGNIDQGVSLENIEAILCAIQEYREMFANADKPHA